MICTMASETTNTSSKRRKTEQGIGTCLLSDLPIGILGHTAGFLAPISRALFAVALTNDENNDNPPAPGENYSSIAGSDWGTLDFGEIQKDFAAKLSDDDVSGILQHIDAVNNVKRLRLTNCTNITGVGLMPLQFSTVIEQIDLSLVGDGENPKLVPDPPISLHTVLPILDSIIASDRCAIKYLQFPHKWREQRNRSTNSAFHAFILRYHQMRVTRDTVRCLNCDVDLPENGQNWIATIDYYYGTHACTCYQCTKHYCYDCEEDGIKNFGYCDRCQRDYCKNCVEIDNCDRCGDFLCEHCSNFTECDKCNEKLCSGCAENRPPTVCVYCGVSYCDDCNDGVDGVRFCDQCPKSCCNSCRLRMCQERISDCDGCIKLLPQNTLVAQLRRLQDEVGHLKNEVSELKLENKELKDKV